MGEDTSTVIKDLVKIFGPIAKEIIYKWAVTQTLTFEEQLSQGLRYFDLRISSKPGKEDLYFIHMLYGLSVEDGLKQINRYLDDHPREVVLLDLNHFYNVTEDQHNALITAFVEIFGEKVCPRQDIKDVTLGRLWANRQQVLIFYHDPIVKEFEYFWCGKSIPAPWANTESVDKLIAFLSEHYNAGRPADSFHVTQGILTPSTAYVTTHLGGSLRTDMSEKAAVPLTTWLKDKHAGPKGINVCTMDFVQWASFVPLVIKLNNNYREG